MTMDRVEGLLTLCRRAGRLVYGFDAVKDACALGKIACVCTASDLSEKSRKEIRFHCGRDNVPVVGISPGMDRLWRLLGKRTGIIGIADAGFASAIQSLINGELER